jgi:hypothetical protein
MADESLAPLPVPPALDLIVQRVPAAVIQQGHEAAKALKDIVDRMPNKVILNGKQYLTIEAWQVLGRFYNVTAKVVDSRYVEYGDVKGFEARAVALHGGAEISAAEAACLLRRIALAVAPGLRVADGRRREADPDQGRRRARAALSAEVDGTNQGVRESAADVPRLGRRPRRLRADAGRRNARSGETESEESAADDHGHAGAGAAARLSARHESGAARHEETRRPALQNLF